MSDAAHMMTVDGLANLVAQIGTPGKDKAFHGTFVDDTLTAPEIAALFSSTWLGKKIASIPVGDMLRPWRAWQTETGETGAIEAEEKRLKVREKIGQAMRIARARGGAAIVMGLPGDASQPVDWRRIGKGQLAYLHVVAADKLRAGDLDSDLLSPNFGLPTEYQYTGSEGVVASIHPDRVVRFIGEDRLDGGTSTSWGESVFKHLREPIRNAMSASAIIASLLYEAKVDVVRVPGLTNALATQQGEAVLIKRFALAGLLKSVNNTLLLGEGEDYEQKVINFAGLPDVHARFLQEVAGAADIPLTRLLGQTPAGFNSTGESDLRNYYDRLSSDREDRLRPALEKIDAALVPSATGAQQAGLWWTFGPLWTPTEAERADIAKKKAEAFKIDVEAGMPLDVMIEARKSQLIEDGTYPGLEDAWDVAEGVSGLQATDAGFDPNQPRDPAGTETGGQWTSGA